jgi:hypothetical protein
MILLQQNKEGEIQGKDVTLDVCTLSQDFFFWVRQLFDVVRELRHPIETSVFFRKKGKRFLKMQRSRLPEGDMAERSQRARGHPTHQA